MEYASKKKKKKPREREMKKSTTLRIAVLATAPAVTFSLFFFLERRQAFFSFVASKPKKE